MFRKTNHNRPAVLTGILPPVRDGMFVQIVGTCAGAYEVRHDLPVGSFATTDWGRAVGTTTPKMVADAPPRAPRPERGQERLRA